MNTGVLQVEDKMKQNPHQTQLLKSIQNLGRTPSIWRVFSDFVEITALAIANTVDKSQFEKREKQYLETINKYNADERPQLADMYEQLAHALNYELTTNNAPADVLGKVFHELELHNHYSGQFFTPQHMCNMMGAMALHDSIGEIEKRGFIGALEPACGSGAMILGFAKAMLDADLNYGS